MKSYQSNYRWVIAALCFLLFFLVIGLGNMTKTLYVIPITKTYNFSRGEFALVFSIMQITNVIVQLFFGSFEKRIGIKALVVIGLLSMPFGYLLFSMSSTLILFYIGAVFVGIGISCSSLTAVSILINNWFKEGKKGTIQGLIVAGSGLGGSLFSLIIGNQISSRGFHSAFLLTSIILIVGAIPIFIFLRSKPQKMDNNSPQQTVNREDNKTVPKNDQENSGFLKSPHIVLALLTTILIGVVVIPTNNFVPAYLYDKGFDAVFATQIASTIFFVQAISKILLGLINDRMGIQSCLYIGLGAYIVGTLILVLANSGWQLWIYAVFGGISMSAIAVLIPLFARAILREEHYNKHLGFFVAAQFGGVVIGNPIVNFIYDFSGTYSKIFIVFTIIGLVAITFSTLALRRRALTME